MMSSFIAGMLLGVIVCACCKVAGRPASGKPVKTLGQ
jgi:gas vesicle protein